MKDNIKPVQVPPIAAIDVGTNSFHLVIGAVTPKGLLRVISRDKEMVRLGSGIGDMKVLSPEAMERGVRALRRFYIQAQKEKATIRAIATSAVREANNKDEFLDLVKRETSITIEVVSGAEEGRLIYLGTIHALPVSDSYTLVIDIGGGSTETVVGCRGDLKYVHSAKLGAIRLMRRFFSNPKEISDSDIALCRDYIRGDWSPVFRALLEQGFEVVVGTSGTITTLAALSLELRGKKVPDSMNGVVVSRDELLKSIATVIEARNPAAISALPSVDSARSDIILAGALILEQAIVGLNIQKITISSYALREGIVFDVVQKARDIQEFHHLAHLRKESVYHVCDVYRVNKEHAEHVKKLSVQIFDQLQPVHSLGDVERELLEAAALMHDVGYHISPDQHHKHSYYIISNCVMPGFTNDELFIIANIARYHRKSHPKRKHEWFIQLAPEKQHIVRVLAAILRIAEGMDRRWQQNVRNIVVTVQESGIEIAIPDSFGVPDIELWGALRRKDLLEEVTGLPVSIQLVSRVSA